MLKILILEDERPQLDKLAAFLERYRGEVPDLADTFVSIAGFIA